MINAEFLKQISFTPMLLKLVDGSHVLAMTNTELGFEYILMNPCFMLDNTQDEDFDPELHKEFDCYPYSPYSDDHFFEISCHHVVSKTTMSRYFFEIYKEYVSDWHMILDALEKNVDKRSKVDQADDSSEQKVVLH